MASRHKCDQKKEKFASGRFRMVSLVCASFFVLGLTVPASAGSLVPFKGAATTTDVVVGFQPPSTLFVLVSGTGNATHLGQFALSELLAFDLTTSQFVGTIAWTAANGDQLFGTSVGVFMPEGTHGTTTFTGGTGRFRNAAGATNFAGVNQGTDASPLFAVTYDGVISSTGANKK